MIRNILTSPKFLFAIFIIVIILIPAGTFLIKQRVEIKSNKNDPKYNLPVTEEASQSASEITDALNEEEGQTEEDEDSVSAGISADVKFGPTLNFKIKIEGRPTSKQAAKVFVGLAQGVATANPEYLLSFTVDVPDNGVFSGLSLAGLTVGNTYTAYLKGPAQIATSSAFLVRSNITELNSGLVLNMISGDMNEDNQIDGLDYTIAKSALGSKPSSSNWNPTVDFNLDNFINSIDLRIISKNIGKVGAGDLYISRPPESTQSGTLTPLGIGSPGYWLWVPKTN